MAVFGVCCEIANVVQLRSLIETKSLMNYWWVNIFEQGESWCKNDNKLLRERIFCGEELASTISEVDVIIFMKMQAYRNRNERKNISTMKGFKRSLCKAVLLVYDSCYIELFVKDHVIAHQMAAVAESVGCNNIQVVTEKTTTRYKLDIR